MGAERIAQVMGAMNGAGVENVIMNYYRAIDRDAFQFDFFVDEGSKHVPVDEIHALGGEVISVPPVSHLSSFISAFERELRNRGYRIVHSNLNALSVFPLYAAKRADIPIRIAHSHSTAGKGETVRNVAKGILKLAANRYPTHRLACSQHAGEWLFGKNASFEVLHNAIVLDRFSFDEGARQQVRSRLGIADDCFCIGHVGRLMEQKNHRYLLNVFQAFQQENPDSALVLVGEGKLEAEMRELARQLGIDGKVIFAGFADDAAPYYSAFDCFVLPSIYEGLGMVAVEAQQNGLRCVLSDKVPVEADASGACAFLPISESDIPRWVAALEEVSRTGRATVRHELLSRFDISHEAHNLEELYRAFLGDNAAV